MRKIKVGIFVVVLLCAISLAGLLAYQALWVNKIVVLLDNQYNQRATAMLNEISAEYAQYHAGASFIEDSLTLTAKIGVNNDVLDSLFSAYIAANGLSDEYEYCIASLLDTGFVHSSSNLKAEYYAIPLSRFLKKDSINNIDNLQLKLYFLNKEHCILGDIWQWLLAYAVFIIVIIFCVLFLIKTVLTQKRSAKNQADFIHSMIHELKTPVATIGMSCKVLKKAGVSTADFDKLRSYAEIVDQENNRIWACVDSLLQMLTVNKRSLNLNKEPVDVNSIIKAAVDGFSVATMAHPATFTLLLNDKLPHILADKMHVRAVIDNIIDNAIKYSPVNSSICIKTEQIGRNIIMVVEDKGRGIAKKDQQRIFKKFYRAAADRKKEVKGFGLGLYYIKQVVDAHNGRVYVKSKLNKGTQIGVLFPVE